MICRGDQGGFSIANTIQGCFTLTLRDGAYRYTCRRSGMSNLTMKLSASCSDRRRCPQLLSSVMPCVFVENAFVKCVDELIDKA
jgi:hypothetical protein